jgi:hypothetical protein
VSGTAPCDGEDYVESWCADETSLGPGKPALPQLLHIKLCFR